jgi:hypothetical protein
MEFLISKLVWWLLAAFVLGLIVGWLSCGRAENEGP